MRILVVDDQRINRFVMTRICQSRGAQVDEASTGEEALAACMANDYDIILLDFNMPKLNGLQTASAVRKMKAPGSAPGLVIVTANPSAVDREAAALYGISSIVPKPISHILLAEAISGADVKADEGGAYKLSQLTTNSSP